MVLKAPDKADYRSAAVEGAVALASALDTAEQQQFVGFVARLSRTPKVHSRAGGQAQGGVAGGVVGKGWCLWGRTVHAV